MAHHIIIKAIQCWNWTRVSLNLSLFLVIVAPWQKGPEKSNKDDTNAKPRTALEHILTILSYMYLCGLYVLVLIYYAIHVHCKGSLLSWSRVNPKILTRENKTFDSIVFILCFPKAYPLKGNAQ